MIAGAREALVVDSCYLPSAAREDIAFIRERVGKPVRYLVNTHWHYDHTMGNGEYAAAYPGISVVAQRETRRNMEGYNRHWFPRYPQRSAALRQSLEKGADESGQALTAEARREIEGLLPGRDAVAREFAALHDRLPDTAFDRELELDLGSRVVRSAIQKRARDSTARRARDTDQPCWGQRSNQLRGWRRSRRRALAQPPEALAILRSGRERSTIGLHNRRHTASCDPPGTRTRAGQRPRPRRA